MSSFLTTPKKSSWETNHEIPELVSDIDVQKTCFLT